MIEKKLLLLFLALLNHSEKESEWLNDVVASLTLSSHPRTNKISFKSIQVCVHITIDYKLNLLLTTLIKYC